MEKIKTWQERMQDVYGLDTRGFKPDEYMAAEITDLRAALVMAETSPVTGQGKLVPDAACKQGKCANVTTGCWGKCSLQDPGYTVIYAPPVVTKVAQPDSGRDAALEAMFSYWDGREYGEADEDIGAALRKQWADAMNARGEKVDEAAGVLFKNYPPSDEAIRQAKQLTQQAVDNHWDHCIFDGPAPAGYANWMEWCSSKTRSGAYIQSNVSYMAAKDKKGGA